MKRYVYLICIFAQQRIQVSILRLVMNLRNVSLRASLCSAAHHGRKGKLLNEERNICWVSKIILTTGKESKGKRAITTVSCEQRSSRRT